MCDDLITQHYLTLTPPPHEIPRIWFAPQNTQLAMGVYEGTAIEAEVTMFTHYGSDIKDQITWLIVPSQSAWNSFRNSKSQMQLWYNITDGGRKKWTINCYSKSILSDRLRFDNSDVPTPQSFNLSEMATDINMLYEMKLGASPRETCNDSFLRSEFTYDRSSDASTWYQSAHPAQATALLGEGPGKEFVISLTPIGSGQAASEDRVGFATVLVGLEDESTKQRFYVSNLWVDKRWRRRGAGGMLMEGVRRRVLEYMDPLGPRGVTRDKEIWLTVFTENAGAVAMYFRLGYQVERTLWVVTGGHGK